MALDKAEDEENRRRTDLSRSVGIKTFIAFVLEGNSV